VAKKWQQALAIWRKTKDADCCEPGQNNTMAPYNFYVSCLAVVYFTVTAALEAGDPSVDIGCHFPREENR
jgi:hypothetical protein